jgi:DNA polymerase III gamma/tau subunit
VRAVLAAVAEAVDRGTDSGWLAKELLRWFRLALLAQVSPDVMASEVAPETATRIAAKAAGLPRTRILATLRNLSEVISQRYSAQPRIDLELALIRVVMPSDELTLQTISDRLRTLEERDGGAASGAGAPPASAVSATKLHPTATPSRKTERAPSKTAEGAAAHGQVAHTDSTQRPEPVAQFPSSVPADPEAQLAAGEPLSLSKLRALWPLVVSAVKERSKPCYGHLEHAAIVDASAQKVTLGVSSKFNRDLLAEPAMAGVIAAAIGEVSGSRPRIECVVVTELASARTTSSADAGAFSLAESVLGADLF